MKPEQTIDTCWRLAWWVIPWSKVFLVCMALAPAKVLSDPPFSGTIFIDPDIITDADPTTFHGLSYAGQDMRTMFDRRVNDWVQVNAFLFNAEYEDGMQIEFQVNPEFGSSENALTPVEFYAPIIGRLPRALRVEVETSWIHMGDELFGGGNNNLLIHTGSIAQGYIQDGILEEVFVHEGAHTSLDASHANTPGWLAAQQADGEFISEFARDFPNREDIAESFLVYVAVRFRSGRISTELENTIRSTIPNRINYFESLDLEILPLADSHFTINAGLNDAWVNANAPFQGMFVTVFPVLKLIFVAWFTFDSEQPPDDVSAVFGAPDQRWVTGLGTYDGNRVELKAELTTGGEFNTSDPLPAQDTNYGTIIIEFSHCNLASVDFDFPAAGESGFFTVQRAVKDNVALCDALK